MKYNRNEIARNIKTRRQKLGARMDELAILAGVNYNTIVKLECGANTNPTAKTLIGLARVFKCRVEDLLT